MVRKVLGTILICLGIAVALYQLIAYRSWEWAHAINPLQPEGIAWIAVALGVMLWATVLGEKRR